MLNEYQEFVERLSIYKDSAYPVVALAEETGEVCSILARELRGDYDNLSQEEVLKLREALIKELGDVMFNVAAICNEAGTTLEHVINTNKKKLEKRAKENKLRGSGDDR